MQHWCKGVRFTRTNMVQTNLTPLHHLKECPQMPAEKKRPHLPEKKPAKTRQSE